MNIKMHEEHQSRSFYGYNFISSIQKRLRGVWRKHRHRNNQQQESDQQHHHHNQEQTTQHKRSGRASNSVNVKATDNYDYVEGDVSRVSGDMSLYQCEMPEEKIRRLKAKRDSMSRLKDLPLGVKSCYPTVNTSKPKYVDYESIIKRPVLVSAEVFERSRNKNYKDTVPEDYLDMEDPPNFDDFMYLRWEEVKSEESETSSVSASPSKNLTGTPPPPYSESPGSLNYVEMLVRSTRIQG